MEIHELQRLLDENHPGTLVKHWLAGHYSIEQRIHRVEVLELNDGSEVAYQEEGLQEIFRIRNRHLGHWIIDELTRRDPRNAHREGNLYHESWKASLAAEAERAADAVAYRKNALESWEIARRSPALMERFGKRLMAGDKYAWTEFSPEVLARNAARHHASELRQKDFWRAI